MTEKDYEHAFLNTPKQMYQRVVDLPGGDTTTLLELNQEFTDLDDAITAMEQRKREIINQSTETLKEVSWDFQAPTCEIGCKDPLKP